MPAGFQCRADASVTLAVKAPPSAMALLPTPIFKKLAADVPALSNWAKILQFKEIIVMIMFFFILSPQAFL